mmetsp:Transcript_8343/g.8941  ORF Transcript_8343/g.8941 Transcript_8343/m.8941 type:complete len:118 (+) Transcript_8343:341-694(+)
MKKTRYNTTPQLQKHTNITCMRLLVVPYILVTPEAIDNATTEGDNEEMTMIVIRTELLAVVIVSDSNNDDGETMEVIIATVATATATKRKTTHRDLDVCVDDTNKDNDNDNDTVDRR